MAHRTCDCRHYPYDCWYCLEECDIKSKKPEHTLAEDKDAKFNKQSELKDHETY